MKEFKSQLLTIASVSFAYSAYSISPVNGLVQGRDGISTRRNVLEVTSNVTCSSEYSWMNNDEGQTPCLVAGYVQGACAEDAWFVSPLVDGYHYNQPNATAGTVNGCSCSWSSYNLFSACTVCQGAAISSVLEWGEYSAECPSSDANSYFPTGYTLSSDTSIPYWASTDPNDWSDVIFNTSQAQTLANEHHADLTPGTSNSSSKPSIVGPVIGGVVGGVAALMIVGVVVFILYKRKKDKTQLSRPVDIDGDENMAPRGTMGLAALMPHMPHSHSPSDSSSYSYLMSTPAMQEVGPRYASPAGVSSVARTPTLYTGSMTSRPEGIPMV